MWTYALPKAESYKKLAFLSKTPNYSHTLVVIEILE